MAVKKSFKAVALFVVLVMTVSSFLPAQLVLAANGQLDTPVVSQSSGIAGAAGTSPVSRNLSWEAVPGAVSYDLYVFNSLADARAGRNPVASASIPQAEDEISLDFRQIMFEELDGSGVTYGPQIVNNRNFIRALHVTGNLRPGAYWVRVRAIAEDESENSELSALPMNRQFADYDPEELPITIAMGSSEVRELIETRFDELGDTLRLVDLRPNIPDPGIFYELWTEGYIRFYEERLINIHWGSEERTTEANTAFMSDEEVLAALPDLDATILFL